MPAHRTDRLGGLTVTTSEDGAFSTLQGFVTDQTALRGIINTLVDMQLRIIAVEQDEPS